MYNGAEDMQYKKGTILLVKYLLVKTIGHREYNNYKRSCIGVNVIVY